MKSRLMGVVCACIVTVITTSTNAALIDRGTGLIYDEDRNITWLQDSNYAKTSGYDDGRMSWQDAKDWASQLEFAGYSNWRLPSALNQDGVSVCTGYNCNESEMGHFFYDELGGQAGGSVINSGNPNEVSKFIWTGDVSLIDVFWFDTLYDPDVAYAFDLRDGNQVLSAISTTSLLSWAVHDGDIGAVPVPPALWLFGSGLLCLIRIARCKKAA